MSGVRSESDFPAVRAEATRMLSRRKRRARERDERNRWMSRGGAATSSEGFPRPNSGLASRPSPTTSPFRQRQSRHEQHQQRLEQTALTSRCCSAEPPLHFVGPSSHSPAAELFDRFIATYYARPQVWAWRRMSWQLFEQLRNN